MITSTSTLWHAAVLSVSACLFGNVAQGAEPPTTETLNAKVGEFMEWRRGAPPEEQTQEAMVAKIEELFGPVAYEELDLEGAQIVARFASMSPELQERLSDRLEMLKKQPDAEGAAAAGMLVASAYTEGDEALATALREALRHPGFGDAIREGLVTDALGMLGYVPDDVLVELKDDIVGLARYFEDAGVELLMSAGSSYVVTLNKLHEHVDAEKREEIRTMIRDRLAEVAEDAEPRTKSYAQSQLAFLDGKFARGELIGHEAPALTFTWTAGGPEFDSLDDLQGKVVVLDFWATWCGPCIASFPNIAELQQRYEGYEVAVVGVTSLQDRHYPGDGPPVDTADNPELEYELMQKFMDEKEMSWIVGFSEQDVFNADFGVRGIPHLAIVDAAGKVRYNGLHPGVTSLAEKASKIDGLLKEAGLPTPPEVESDE